MLESSGLPDEEARLLVVRACAVLAGTEGRLQAETAGEVRENTLPGRRCLPLCGCIGCSSDKLAVFQDSATHRLCSASVRHLPASQGARPPAQVAPNQPPVLLLCCRRRQTLLNPFRLPSFLNSPIHGTPPVPPLSPPAPLQVLSELRVVGAPGSGADPSTCFLNRSSEARQLVLESGLLQQVIWSVKSEQGDSS